MLEALARSLPCAYVMSTASPVLLNISAEHTGRLAVNRSTMQQPKRLHTKTTFTPADCGNLARSVCLSMGERGPPQGCGGKPISVAHAEFAGHN